MPILCIRFNYSYEYRPALFRWSESRKLNRILSDFIWIVQRSVPKYIMIRVCINMFNVFLSFVAR